MRWVGVAIALVWLALPQIASADRIDVNVRQLRAAGDYKVRLSAALALAKTRDVRAVGAIAGALADDREQTVRRVAALSLGKMVDARMPVELREQVLSALERAARSDRDRRVRKNARRALELLAHLRPRDGAVFIHVAAPADLSRKVSRRGEAQLRAAVLQTLRDIAPDYAVEWPTGEPPTRRELRARKVQAFFVGTTISMVQVRRRGRQALIKCSVSLRVSPWGGRGSKERWRADESASATGNGQVTSGTSRRDIAAGTRDCVLAVAQQVTAQQVVPFIRRRASH